MNVKTVFPITLTFALLLIVGVLMAVSARLLENSIDQIVLIGMGSALVSGSLAFYLNQMFNLDRESRQTGTG